jgi:hypothetical protein
MQYKLTTVHQVISKIIRDLGLGDKEINWQDMIEWIADAMQHIGAYNQYEEKRETLELDNGRTKLPCDFYKIVEGHSSRYKIYGDTIIVDTTASTFDITYLSFKLDEQGFPLIPDHVSYTDALFWKVCCQLAMREELPNKSLTYDYCRQKWNFYCRQARAKLSELDEQEKALFARAFLTNGVDINQYPGFKGRSNNHIK